MFHFFHTIFSGVTSLVASAIIAVGIVSMPSPEPIVQPLPQIQNEEVLAVQQNETQKTEEQKSETVPTPTPVKLPISKTSEATPTPEPTATPTPASVPTPTPTTPASTPVLTPSTTSTSNSNKGEWVIDTRSGSSKYGTQIFVPEGKTLDEVSPLTTASVTAEALKITSVNISSTNQIMTFDWTTSKPATGKVFFTGNNYSQSSDSGSGLSTRHIVNFYSLNADSEYSYEIESVAGEEVVKKDGTFSTKPDKKEIKVINVDVGPYGLLPLNPDGSTATFPDGSYPGYVSIFAQYLINNSPQSDVQMIFREDDGVNATSTTINSCGLASGYGKTNCAYFGYRPVDGTKNHIITLTADDFSQEFNLNNF